MKLKTKIKLGAVALVGGIATGLALNKILDDMVKMHLSREGVTNPRGAVMSKSNQDDFANSPETILGHLFYVSTPHINVTIPNREGRHINAMLYKQDCENSKYAIVVHGYRSSVKAVSYIARRYYENGYNVLIPYMRAHHGTKQPEAARESAQALQRHLLKASTVSLDLYPALREEHHLQIGK